MKRILKIRPNLNERNVYAYYNHSITFNGYLVEETEKFYVTDFKNNFNKKIKLRKNQSSDLEVFKQFFSYKEYLPVVNAYKDNFSIKADYCLNIIDAGSNIGLTLLFFMDYFDRPNIICIEP
jgi:hypothetical protein